MKRRNAVLSALCLALAAGCTPSQSPSPSDHQSPTKESSSAHTHEHGPNGGEVIELGGEYHAELVHDASSVTIYILDGSAKNTAAVAATELTINLLHDGKPEQFKLAAQSQASDPAGKSSKFTSSDSELAAHVDDPASAAKLSLTVDGKPYRAELAHSHDHDHEGHDHDDHDHDKK
jgi:hypothetical protein